jgi:hypothetical protein
MIDTDDMAQRSAKLREAFEAKLGVRGRDLDQSLRRAGRMLPRRLRRQGRLLASAERMAGNPRLSRQADGGDVGRAFDAMDTYLAGVDAGERRRARLIALGASVGFNLLMVFALVVLWLWWRDIV